MKRWIRLLAVVIAGTAAYVLWSYALALWIAKDAPTSIAAEPEP